MLFLKYFNRGGVVWLLLILLGGSWNCQSLAASTTPLTTCYCSDGRAINISEDWLSKQCFDSALNYTTNNTVACNSQPVFQSSMTWNQFSSNTYSCSNTCEKGTPLPSPLIFLNQGGDRQHIWQTEPEFLTVDQIMQGYEAEAIDAVAELYQLGNGSTELIMNAARDNVRAVLFARVVTMLKKETRTADEQQIADFFTQKVKTNRIAAANFALTQYNDWKDHICGVGPGQTVNGTGWLPPMGFTYDWDTMSISQCVPSLTYRLSGGPLSPSADEFVAYGIAHQYNQLNLDPETKAISERTAKVAITFASLGIGAALGSAAAFIISTAGLTSTLMLAIAPFAVSTKVVAAATPFFLTAIASSVLVVVMAIIIAVLQGISVFSQEQIPLTLQQKLTEAQITTPDIRTMAGTSTGIQEIYPNFILATMPNKAASLGPAPAAASDPVFSNVTGEGAGAVASPAIVSLDLKPYDISTVSAVRVRMSGRWFAVTETPTGGSAGPEKLTLSISIKDWDGNLKTVWRKNDKFVVVKEGETNIDNIAATDDFAYLDAQDVKKIARYVASTAEASAFPYTRPPTISYTVSGVLNGNLSNMYASNPTVQWLVLNPDGTPVPQGDILFGCVNGVVYGGPGAAFASSTTVSCSAKNSFGSARRDFSFAIDGFAPSLQLSYSAEPNLYNWYNVPVSVTYNCQEVEHIPNALDPNASGLNSCPPNEMLSEGVTPAADQVATDRAGNVTTQTRREIKIDRIAPVATISSISPAPPNAAGWLRQNSTFTVDCVDTGGSKLKFCPSQAMLSPFYLPIVPSNLLAVAVNQITNTLNITEEGVLTPALFVSDIAGNRVDVNTYSFKLDKTAPTISLASRTPTANADGWNNSDVTLKFNCVDALPAFTGVLPIATPTPSGIKTCPLDTTISAEGVASSAYTAVDIADNQQQTTVEVKLDKTIPSISSAPDRPANAAGWYNAPVLASFTCSDTLSGIKTCPSPQTLTEGLNRKATGTAEDLAGNQATAEASFNIDTTPPQISGAATILASTTGWYNTDVPVSFSCSDTVSGIQQCHGLVTLSSEGRNLSVMGSSLDRAGNSSNTVVGNINIDKTAPTCRVTATPNQLGLVANRVVNISTTVTTNDALSGVNSFKLLSVTGSDNTGIQGWTLDSADTSGQLTAKRGASYTLTYQVRDNAGNVGQCSTNIVGLFNIRG